MILVDSSVWIDFFNGENTPQVAKLDFILNRELIVIGDLILLEVLQGFVSDSDFMTAKNQLDQLLYMEMLGKRIAIKCAENYRKLRKKGITPRKTIDLIIATFCIENNLSLLHNDKDFDIISKYLDLEVIV